MTSDRKKRKISPLTLKILGVNVFAVFILAFGVIYSAQYEDELITSELSSLQKEAKLIAAAISEGGTRDTLNDNWYLASDLSQLMIRKISAETDFRIMLYNSSGHLIADSHQLSGAGGSVEIIELPPPEHMMPIHERLKKKVGRILKALPTRVKLSNFPNFDNEVIQTIPGMIETISGERTGNAWYDSNKNILITASEPVAKLKKVLGGIMLVRDGERIQNAINSVQLNVLRLFLAALAITIFLSLYLSATIASPILLLSKAADKIRKGTGDVKLIPDLSKRKDEIGDLSISLRDMTATLNERLSAIESFAADVAHELKNPLASVRSAIETLDKVSDKNKRDQLIKIIKDDILRLDRLITDISAASRLDAELSRIEHSAINLVDFIGEIVSGYQDRYKDKYDLRFSSDGNPRVLANSGQLSQVLSNLISNAFSFSGEDKPITIDVWNDAHNAYISVKNQGPHIPENKLEQIFDRFYTERPEGETFGRHSGLGLSISKQIVNAHNGTIHAENLLDDNEQTSVLFTVTLPLY